MLYKNLLSCIAYLILPLCALAQPQFKGGSSALDAYLTKNIIYPEYSRQNCIAGVVQVAFKLDKTGKVYEAKVQQGLGIDLDDEALRVIKMTSNKWELPAGYEGNATLILPVRFTPDYSRCALNSNQVSQATAINNYLAREELQNAVTNYYKNKYLGKADTTKQAEIDRLKKQLGFDEAFITDVLQQADEKQRQGDKEGACETWQFIRNIGSNRADDLITKYCGK
jgi:TonB family protein